MDSVASGSRSSFILLSRNQLSDYLRSCTSRDITEKIKFLADKVKNDTTVEISEQTNKILTDFAHEHKRRWLSASRNKNNFLKKNTNWLQSEIMFLCRAHGFVGRPQMDFSNLSERSKRRKTEDLRSNYSIEELSYAAQMQLRKKGKINSSKVMRNIIFSSPSRGGKYQKALKKLDQETIPYTAEEALSIVVEGKLTKFQYNLIRDSAIKHNNHMYPNYAAVLEAKKKCYPENLVITESVAETPLQSLLDHTTQRLFQGMEDVIETLHASKNCNIHLISKWGCDGSSGMSEYKQRFTDPNISDANMFLTSFVPLQLVSGDPESQNKIILWQNPRPSSTRLCRPIRIQFVHETTDVTIREFEYIENQISNLTETVVDHVNGIIPVKHKMLLTMIDGKVCNAITETSSNQRCYLCNLTSKDFNKMDLVLNKQVHGKSKLRFGLSSLHAWIRFFECLLHVSYKLSLKQWQVRGEENKRTVKENKKRIQEAFRNRMGLLVDKPKPGYGSTNDGNTARRFFHDSVTSSEITHIDENIICRFRVVLLTISSGFPIQISRFKEFCIDTANLFVELYPWYNMPTTVHKILIHSPEIISEAILPIGQLGEEAQESRNKDIKRFRESFARKFSRYQNMEDVFHNILVTSNPFISSLRKLTQKIGTPLPSEVLQFLMEPEVEQAELV